MIGQFVISKAGHDKGEIYVIVAEQDGYLYLSEGRLKPPDKPKKKKPVHVQQVQRTVDEALLVKLQSGERVEPEAVKYAIKQYQKAITR